MQEWNCCVCDDYVNESYPHYQDVDDIYCWNCSFKANLIDQKQFIVFSGISNGTRAAYNKSTDEIEIVVGREKFSWEKTDGDYRHNKEYIDWRKSVFERDLYTCQKCKVRGGSLEAHHIKLFKDYIELRYEINNGMTLCKKCHKQTHKEIKNGN
jgi:hypothetical protein